MIANIGERYGNILKDDKSCIERMFIEKKDFLTRKFIKK